jgi:hypothetical protein
MRRRQQQPQQRNRFISVAEASCADDMDATRAKVALALGGVDTLAGEATGRLLDVAGVEFVSRTSFIAAALASMPSAMNLMDV